MVFRTAHLKLGANIVTRLVLAAIFGVSGIQKVMYPFAFADVLSKYALPPAFIDMVVSVLPTLEILVATLLLFGLVTRITSLVAMILLAVYTLIIIYSLASGNIDHGCGCFLSAGGNSGGLTQFLVGGSVITLTDVVRDVLFLGFAVVVYLTYVPRFGLDAIWMRLNERDKILREQRDKKIRAQKLIKRNGGRQTAKLSSDLTLSEWLNNRFYFVLGAFGIFVLSVVCGMVTYMNLVEAQNPPLVYATDFHPAVHTLQVGRKAPGFHLSTLAGESYSLQQYRGKVVLLEFFAVWCPHCQAQAPIIRQLNTLYPHTKLQILSVIASPYSKDYDISGGLDTATLSGADVKWFEQTYHVTNPILVDSDFHVTNEYLGNDYPTLYVIDKHGMIRDVFTGTTSENKLTAAIRALA